MMRMATRLYIAACILVSGVLTLGLAACTGSSPSASYFPLQAGHQGHLRHQSFHRLARRARRC